MSQKSSNKKNESQKDSRFNTEAPGFTVAELCSFHCAHCGKGFANKIARRPGQHGLPTDRPFITGGIVAVNENGRMLYYHGYVGRSGGCFEAAMAKSPETERFDRSPAAEQKLREPKK